MAKAVETQIAIPQEPVKTQYDFPHYPLTEAEEKEWLKQFNTDFRKREEAMSLGSVVRDVMRISVAMKLNNGTKDGKVQTVSVNLGTINSDRYDDQKAMNIAVLAKEVLSKDFLYLYETKSSALTNQED